MRQRRRGNPRPLIVIVIALALIGGFFAVVAPLFETSGAATAELGGVLPTRATAGRTLQIDIGFDNTGSTVISPTCVQVGVQGPIRAASALFQGIDREPFRSGEACGGSLNGQETISLVLQLEPEAPGRASVTLVPAQGSTPIGAGLAGAISISAS